MSKPLEGLLVVCLEQAVAAPYCSQRLCDAGARVIKVERPQGDFARHYDAAIKGESANFVWLNRGKESVVLNIKQEKDLNLLQTLLRQSDVFIQNLAPGARERAGIEYDQLRQENPGLITCDISGYGEGHERAAMPAYDLLVQAETGLCSLTGSPEQPGRVGVSVCDIAAGMNAYQNILEALIARGVNGQGREIKISLFDSMADWMTVPFLHYEGTGISPKRMGVRHPSIAPYGIFETKDHKTLVISIQNEREWARLCQHILHKPDWAQTGPYSSAILRVENRTSLDRDIQDILIGYDLEELCHLCMAHKIAFGRLNTIEDLCVHPALKRLSTQTEHGVIEVPCPPGKQSDDFETDQAVPALGAHTAAIWAEFGK